MRSYSGPERTLMLLCALPGQVKPLRESLYRHLFRMYQALGPESAPDEELTEENLRRLGCNGEEAQEILCRLEQREALELWLRGLEQKGIYPMTRLSPGYPQRLRSRMGDRAPLVLFCSGEESLLETQCMSVVGSRKLREPGRLFARTAGEKITEQGYTYCSGGAAGADTEGFLGTGAEGRAIIFLPDSLENAIREPMYKEALRNGRLLLISETGTDFPFSTVRAMARNRLIHAMGEKVFAAQSDYGTGGTWNGVLENLRSQWSPVYVCWDEPEDSGAMGLRDRGCLPLTKKELEAWTFPHQPQLSCF